MFVLFIFLLILLVIINCVFDFLVKFFVILMIFFLGCNFFGVMICMFVFKIVFVINKELVILFWLFL